MAVSSVSPGRLYKPNREGTGPDRIVLKSDTDAPLFLEIDPGTERSPKRIVTRFLPFDPRDGSPFSVEEWIWENGPAGTGYSRETAQSQQGGGSEHGRFAWFRRKGVVQPAGQLTELTLPAGTALLTSGRFTSAAEFGSHLVITTGDRSIVAIPNGNPSSTLVERDFGSGSVTTGIAVFALSGTAMLYVADAAAGIKEWDGSGWTTGWTTGASGTERRYLATPSWSIGAGLASGGLAGTAGTYANRLVGVNASTTGFYHVAADPKVSANWSSLTTIGMGEGIQNVTQSNHNVFFGMRSGIRTVNELGYDPNLVKWMERSQSPTQNLRLEYWNGLIWSATDQGLMVFEPDGSRIDIATLAQFGENASNSSPVFGRPRALCPTRAGLYAGYYDGTDSYVGLLMFDQETSAYRWSMAEAVIEDEEITFIYESSLSGFPYLFIGTTESDGHLHLYYQPLPVSGDPERDYLIGLSTFRAAPEWSVTLSRTNGGRPVKKIYRRWQMEYDRVHPDLHPGNYVEVYVSPDNGGYALEGTATENARWSAAPSAAFVQQTSVQVKLVVHNATTVPVAIRAFGHRYSSRPELTKVVTYPIRVTDRDGEEDPRSRLIRAEQCQYTGTLTFVDHLGRTGVGIVEATIGEDLIEETAGRYSATFPLTISTTADVALFDQALADVDSFV